MEQKKLTDKQKAILTEKLQERLLGVAVPAIAGELELLTGKDVTFTSVFGLGKKIGNIHLVFHIGKLEQSKISINVNLEEIPTPAFEDFLSQLGELFLS